MAYIYGYSVGWLRQEENLLVENPSNLVTRPAPADDRWPASVS